MKKTFLIIQLIFICGCYSDYIIREVSPPGSFTNINDSPYLKAHSQDGHLFLYSSWQINDDSTIEGTAKHFNENRELIDSGYVKVPFKNLALLETNKLFTGNSTYGLYGITLISGAISVGCIFNPKACFGSCPTVYVKNESGEKLTAELFSSSIARAFEKVDIDALQFGNLENRELELLISNEAYESHFIKDITLLAVKKKINESVFLDGNSNFYLIDSIAELHSSTWNNQIITNELGCADNLEFKSESDSNDLSLKEIIYLDFPKNDFQKSGLILHFRQSLLTTYLFYQLLGYLGTNYSDYLFQIEKDNKFVNAIVNSALNHLGGIEVEYLNEDGEWVEAGTVNETGPIAKNIEVLPINAAGVNKIRLTLTKGMWRIDYAALGNIIDEVKPMEIFPQKIVKNNTIEGSQNFLSTKNEYLVHLPGDTSSVQFNLPESQNSYEYFIKARGYYYEWMRDVWMGREDNSMVQLFIDDTDQFLKQHAAPYKLIEAEMDTIFWNSRYEKH